MLDLYVIDGYQNLLSVWETSITARVEDNGYLIS